MSENLPGGGFWRFYGREMAVFGQKMAYFNVFNSLLLWKPLIVNFDISQTLLMAVLGDFGSLMGMKCQAFYYI